MAIPVGWILGLLALLPRRNPDPLGFGLEEPDKPGPPGSPPPQHGMSKPAPSKPSTVTPGKVPPAVVVKVKTQPAPWPAVKPGSVPPFPSAAWVYDEPPPKAVQARALQLLPTLHARGVGAHVTEFTDGRWISYVARMHEAKRSVEAYRLRTAPKVVPVKGSRPAPVQPAPSHPDVVLATTPATPTAPLGPGAGPSGSVPATVMLGSKGPNVERAQRLLGVVMKPGAAYGTFGEYTRQAAINYQRAHGLQPDGVVGPATWSALLGVGSSPPPAAGPLSPSSGLLA